MQMLLAWIIGVVVAIGLIWSVAVMSNLVPVVVSESAMSQRLCLRNGDADLALT
jgi:hypothetical protein